MIKYNSFIERDVRQVIDNASVPYEAYLTEPLWLGKQKEYHSFFAKLTEGNAVTPLITGEEYFKELMLELDKAEGKVFITGWQINWDALLAPGVRLFDVVLKHAKRGVKFYILPWDDSAPVQTYDDQTRSVFERINEIELTEQRIFTLLAASNADKATSFFSNHQKVIVIDDDVGFVGGIDLAYGRFDDEKYGLDLGFRPGLRVAMNQYNPCIKQLGKLSKNKVCDPDLLTGLVDHFVNRKDTWKAIKKGAYQVPYEEDGVLDPRNQAADYTTIDAKIQPRMPWQDSQVKVVGPAVADLALNFVLRWNAIVGRRAEQGDIEAFQMAGYELPLPEPAENHQKSGSCKVQVLRSAPEGLRQAEYAQLENVDRARFPRPDNAQMDIMQAMIELIAKSQHYIYIENQFFQSDFGKEITNIAGPGMLVQDEVALKVKAGVTRLFPGDANGLPENHISRALADRVGKAILDRNNPDFHVIITLPVHPEGQLNDTIIMSQVHWTMQTIMSGSQSLVNRVRRYIKLREMREANELVNGQVDESVLNDPDNTRYMEVDIEECDKYLTLLNLRNWAKIKDAASGTERYVTEQIYVHSKLMIVDDLYAIVGSANINDRSLLGSRDSELSVLVMDTDTELKDIRGNGKPIPVRKFAHEFRKKLWSKIFGLSGNDRPAKALQNAIEQPASPESWRKIQEVARNNTALYEAAFRYIPRNEPFVVSKNIATSSQSNKYAYIWPTWTQKDGLSPYMPFTQRFWESPEVIDEEHADELNNVRGYITELPIHWTEGGSNDMGYHLDAVALVGSDSQIESESISTFVADNDLMNGQSAS